jgi:hypothetical protein
MTKRVSLYATEINETKNVHFEDENLQNSEIKQKVKKPRTKKQLEAFEKARNIRKQRIQSKSEEIQSSTETEIKSDTDITIEKIVPEIKLEPEINIETPPIVEDVDDELTKSRKLLEKEYPNGLIIGTNNAEEFKNEILNHIKEQNNQKPKWFESYLKTKVQKKKKQKLVEKPIEIPIEKPILIPAPIPKKIPQKSSKIFSQIFGYSR